MDKGQPPTIGIAIPAYQAGGHGEYLLGRCLSSIAAQSQLPSEVVVSAEEDFFQNAMDVAAKWGKELNLRVLRNSGSPGIGANSNVALRQLETDYAWVLHQDDSLGTANTVAEVSREVELDLAAWIVLQTRHVDPFLGGTLPSRATHSTWSGVAFLLTGRNCVGPPSAVVWKRSESLVFDPKLTLLVDIGLYLDIFRTCRLPPRSVNALVDVGEWSGQTQKGYQRSRILREIPRLLRHAPY